MTDPKPTKDPMLQRRAELIKLLEERWEELRQAVEEFNEAIEEAWEPVASAQDDLNETLEQINQWNAQTAGAEFELEEIPSLSLERPAALELESEDAEQSRLNQIIERIEPDPNEDRIKDEL